MKAINHHKDNYTYDSSNDGSVMNGTIYMTAKEWETAKAMLRKAYTRAKRLNDTYTRDALSHTLTYTITHLPDVKPYDTRRSFCIGVTATELLFQHFKLPHYKKQNYQIIIKNHHEKILHHLHPHF